ncbi:MAG: hypothetical protein V1824_02835, partial [archaeon]
MSGIFGAGVLSAFNKHRLQSRVHSIYAVSAGAHISAYFLSQKPIEIEGVYLKALLSKRTKFFNTNIIELASNFFKLLFQRKNLHLLDLEALKDIQNIKRKLNYHKIKNSPINFYVAVFDHKKMKIKYIDGKKEILETINLSSYLPPYIYLKTKSKD